MRDARNRAFTFRIVLLKRKRRPVGLEKWGLSVMRNDEGQSAGQHLDRDPGAAEDLAIVLLGLGIRRFDDCLVAFLVDHEVLHLGIGEMLAFAVDLH